MFIHLIPLLIMTTNNRVERALDPMIGKIAKMTGDYQIQLQYRRQFYNQQDAVSRWSEYSARIWRAKSNLRIDVFNRNNETSHDSDFQVQRHVICSNCERSGHVLITMIYPPSHRTRHVVDFKPLKNHNPDYYGLDIDWRKLGLQNWSLPGYIHLDATAAYQNLYAQQRATISRDIRLGKSCTVISDKIDGREWKIWISDEDDGNPIFFDSTSQQQGVIYHQSTDIKWMKSSGGHMFPQTIKHLEEKNGKLDNLEDITIIHADFKTPIDPVIFTLKGLDLNDNQRLMFPELQSEDHPRWNQGGIDHSLSENAKSRDAVEMGKKSAVPLSTPPRAAYPNQSNTYLIIGIVSGVVTLFCLSLAILSRRRRGAI
jgi:hypothetical protein